MATQILYYSMTGNTALVCRALADRLGCAIGEITAPYAGGGFWTMMRLGFATMTGRSTRIAAPPVTAGGDHLLILGAPVWAWRLSVPMRSFLEAGPTLPERVALVLTSGDPRRPDKVFDDFARRTGRVPVATLHVDERLAKSGDFTDRLDAFCAAIGG